MEQADFITWLQDTMFVVFDDLNKGYADEFRRYIGSPREEERKIKDSRAEVRRLGSRRSRGQIAMWV